jgi:hypothetical protein
MIDGARELFKRGLTIRYQQVCQPLIRQTQETSVRWADAQGVQGGQRFRMSQFSPALSISSIQPPLALQYALRPWIVISICAIKDMNGCTSAHCALQNHATCERFVIGVWRDQHQPRIRCEYWSRHRWVHLETRVTDAEQQSTAISHWS